MSKTLTNDQIKHIVEELEINQPIMSYKVVGSRVELRLLGGLTAVYNDPEAEPAVAELVEALARLKIKDIRFLATKFMIPKRGSMNKIQLIEALSNQDPTSLAAAIKQFDL